MRGYWCKYCKDLYHNERDKKYISKFGNNCFSCNKKRKKKIITGPVFWYPRGRSNRCKTCKLSIYKPRDKGNCVVCREREHDRQRAKLPHVLARKKVSAKIWRDKHKHELLYKLKNILRKKKNVERRKRKALQ